MLTYLKISYTVYTLATIFTLFNIIMYFINDKIPSNITIITWGIYFALSMFYQQLLSKKQIEILKQAQSNKPGDTK